VHICLGIVSLEGSYPPAEGMEQVYEVCGPICRYSVDLALTFKVMAGENVNKLHLDKEVGISGFCFCSYISGLSESFSTMFTKFVLFMIHSPRSGFARPQNSTRINHCWDSANSAVLGMPKFRRGHH
jgi:hypothetical protein